jgi:hypothetical protein
MIKDYKVSALGQSFLMVDTTFYVTSIENLEKILELINTLGKKPVETEAQKSQREAKENELFSVKEKIAAAVLKGDYQTTFSIIWNDTEDKLKEAGYRLSIDPRYNSPAFHPTLTVSWN